MKHSVEDELMREARLTTDALRREIKAYWRLRNSIWFAVKINGFIALLIIASTFLHAAIFWADLKR